MGTGGRNRHSEHPRAARLVPLPEAATLRDPASTTRRAWVRCARGPRGRCGDRRRAAMALMPPFLCNATADGEKQSFGSGCASQGTPVEQRFSSCQAAYNQDERFEVTGGHRLEEMRAAQGSAARYSSAPPPAALFPLRAWPLPTTSASISIRRPCAMILQSVHQRPRNPFGDAAELNRACTEGLAR